MAIFGIINSYTQNKINNSLINNNHNNNKSDAKKVINIVPTAILLPRRGGSEYSSLGRKYSLFRIFAYTFLFRKYIHHNTTVVLICLAVQI